jgi:adenylosuccinate lyase
MTTLNELNAISPIDGRYKQDYFAGSLFSEEALIKYRVLVEIYFIALCEVPCLNLAGVPDLFESLRNIIKISTEDALIKETESDQPRCKSGGILIKDAFEKLGLSEYKEFIHFGLTSQDINNTAIPLSTKEVESVHAFDYFDIKIERSKYRKDVPMLAHAWTTGHAFGERNWCFCRTRTNAFVV